MKKKFFDLFRDLFMPGHTKETTKNMKLGGFMGPVKHGKWNKWEQLAEIQAAQRERAKNTRVRCTKCGENFVTPREGGNKTCPICKMGLDTVVRVKKKKDPDKGLPMKDAVKSVQVSLKSDPGFYAVPYMTIARILANIGKSAKWLSEHTGLELHNVRAVKRHCKQHIALHGIPVHSLITFDGYMEVQRKDLETIKREGGNA